MYSGQQKPILLSENSWNPLKMFANPGEPPSQTQSQAQMELQSYAKCILCHHDVHPNDAVLPRPCLHGPLHAECIISEERLAFAAAGATGRSPTLRCLICHAEVASIAYDLCTEIPSLRLTFQPHPGTIPSQGHLSSSHPIQDNFPISSSVPQTSSPHHLHHIHAVVPQFNRNEFNISNLPRVQMDVHVFHHYQENRDRDFCSRVYSRSRSPLRTRRSTYGRKWKRR